MKKLMALSGQGRAALELWEEQGETRFALRPPVQGRLWLCGGNGELFSPGRGRCPFEPVGALILKDGRVVMQGGFTGRRALLEQARRQLYRDAPPAPKPPLSSNPPATPRPTEQPSPARPQPQPQPQPVNSQALVQILRTARELFSPLQPPEPQPQPANPPALNPFPSAFPMSRWRRVPYPGTGRHYLEGEMFKNGVTYIIHALPGEYRPGKRPRGFERYLRGRDGSGYWIKVSVRK